MKKKKPSTPFDDVFRTMLNIPYLLIDLVNEMFSLNYDRNEEVEYLKEEFQQSYPKRHKIICDSHVVIGKEKKSFFHLECQTYFDSNILFRMYEYDSQIALLHSIRHDQELLLNFPRSGILYLNRNRNIADEKIVIGNEEKEQFSYKISSLSMYDYSVRELINRKLYSLLPFFFFTYGIYPYDNVFEEKTTWETFRNDLIKILDFVTKSADDRQIDAYTYTTLIGSIRTIVLYLCFENSEAEKEVNEIMGGSVIELEEVRMLNEMIANSRNEGFMEGVKQGVNILLDVLVESGKLSRSEADELLEKCSSRS